MTPSVGRIVHFMKNGEICAAIICYVHSASVVNLAYFTPNGIAHSETSVSYAETIEEYRWSWPPRV